MKKVFLALIPVVALSAGFASQASAGQTCWAAAHKICDWAYPVDQTFEGALNYSNCMISAAPICNANAQAELNASSLTAKAERMPKPSPSLLKKYSRANGKVLARQ